MKSKGYISLIVLAFVAMGCACIGGDVEETISDVPEEEIWQEIKEPEKSMADVKAPVPPGQEMPIMRAPTSKLYDKGSFEAGCLYTMKALEEIWTVKNEVSPKMPDHRYMMLVSIAAQDIAKQEGAQLRVIFQKNK